MDPGNNNGGSGGNNEASGSGVPNQHNAAAGSSTPIFGSMQDVGTNIDESELQEDMVEIIYKLKFLSAVFVQLNMRREVEQVQKLVAIFHRNVKFNYQQQLQQLQIGGGDETGESDMDVDDENVPGPSSHVNHVVVNKGEEQFGFGNNSISSNYPDSLQSTTASVGSFTNSNEPQPSPED